MFFILNVYTSILLPEVRKFEIAGWGKKSQTTAFTILHLFDSILFFKINVVRFILQWLSNVLNIKRHNYYRLKISGEKKLPKQTLFPIFRGRIKRIGT